MVTPASGPLVNWIVPPWLLMVTLVTAREVPNVTMLLAVMGFAPFHFP